MKTRAFIRYLTRGKGIAMYKTRPTWERVSNDQDRYALRMADSKAISVSDIRRLLNRVIEAEGVGRDFSERAQRAFEGWLADSSKSLASHAYALLSNWFLTAQDAARNSHRGYAARQLWDALFAAVPSSRLTLTDANDTIEDDAFGEWWQTQTSWQDFELREAR